MQLKRPFALMRHLERELAQRDARTAAVKAPAQLEASMDVAVKLHVRELPLAQLRQQRGHLLGQRREGGSAS